MTTNIIMKLRENIFILFIFIFSELLSQDFVGESGIFILNPANKAITAAEFNQPFVDGGVARTKWEYLESSPGIFNWEFLDGEIATAESAGKSLSIAIIRQPVWLIDSLGAESYFAIDYNQYHSTYLDTLEYVVNYDSIVIERYKILIDSLAERYSGNLNIAYFRIFTDVPMDLPLIVADGTPFYEAVFYHPDTVLNCMKDLTNHYMQAFPEIPLWVSPDHVRFEGDATGHLKNYLADTLMKWGASTYPERFGVWREDLSGCVIVTAENENTHWYVMSQHPCRNGSQMVWNVQDGPRRMNNCYITPRDDSPESKAAVLDSAISAGLSISMRYYEIYSRDLKDSDLHSALQVMHDRISDYFSSGCDTSLNISPLYSLNKSEELIVFPNPSSGLYEVHCKKRIDRIELLSLDGKIIKLETDLPELTYSFDLSGNLNGIYLLRVFTGAKTFTRRIVKTN